MTFLSRITRHPIAFAPDDTLDAVPVPPEARDLVQGVAGCSPYLARLMRTEATWLEGVWGADPDAVLAGVLADVAALEGAAMKPGLRRAKRRVAVLTALADCGGVWGTMQVTAALTRFAQAAVHQCLTDLIGAQIARGKLPGQGADDVATAGGMVALAMGKMGAYELNYSSDIDLICLFDETRFAPDDYAEARACFVKVTRQMMAQMSDITADGYVFRTDLRLRPDPSVTPVCLSMEAAERYYEALGRTWERAAHIKARACAGDIAAGEGYLGRLRPFVYRKHLDFASIEEAHDMRLKIRDHKGLGGALRIEGHDMKLGRGGIREIEFFTQTRQIIAGGRDPSLQLRGTLEGLDALVAADWVPGDVAAQMSDNYLYFRDVEHRLQMVQDAQTHKMPKSEGDIRRIANFMGTDDVAAFRADLLERLAATERLTDPFFSREAKDAPAPVEVPDFSDEVLATMDRWATYPALRSQRARGIFKRLRPTLLASLGKAARPDEALLSFDGFLRGLPAGVQLFSLFEANPHLVDLIVDIAVTAPDLARYLSRNSSVLDAVLSGDFLSDLPDAAGLLALLEEALAAASDYEASLDIARRWHKEAHFRVGVQQLRGLIDGIAAGEAYAALAEATVTALWPRVCAEFAVRHGAVPGRGAVLVAMGSLGAGRLNARSDLDLIVIYDAQADAVSDGARSLMARPYFAKLTQAMITALSAPTAEGRLYEVDMRLRPSGRQGPVATSLTSFVQYQADEAWVWEHLALTRARAMAGDPGLMQAFEAARVGVLSAARYRPAEVRAGLAEMRERLQSAGRVGHVWAPKLGAGRMQDIELAAQAVALMAADPVRTTEAQCLAGGILGEAGAATLTEAYHALACYLQALRLLSAENPVPSELGLGAQAFLLQATGAASLDALEMTLSEAPARAARVIDEMLDGA